MRADRLRRVAVPAALALVALGVLAVFAFRGGDEPAGAAAASAQAARASARTVTIGWGGDTVLASRYGQDKPGALLAGVRHELRTPDVSLLNLEGTLGAGGTGKCAADAEGCYAFQGPPAAARELRRAGVDLVNLANNHMNDFGPAGAAQTVVALGAARVGWTGLAGQVRVVHRPGELSVGVVGLSTYPWTSDLDDPAQVRDLVSFAGTLADVVVVVFHGGAEGAAAARTPVGAESFLGERRGGLRAFARGAIDAGADLVLGSGPHVLRGMERYRGRLIAYSLGNLAGPGAFSTSGELALSGHLTVRLDARGRLRAGRLVSLRVDGGVPRRDPKGAAGALMTRLGQEDFGPAAVQVGPRGLLRWRGRGAGSV